MALTKEKSNMDDEKNIVKFELKTERFTIKKKTFRETTCRHGHTTINEKRRLVECDACGTCIEPYDYIYMVAKREVSIRYDIKSLLAERAELRRQIERLKKDKHNVKAQINRLK